MSALISLIILLIVVGLVAAVVIYLVDMLPIDARFKTIARVLIILVALLIVLVQVLPMLDVGLVAVDD